MVLQVLYSQQAVTQSLWQLGQCPGRLEARLEACYALSLKSKQTFFFFFNFPNILWTSVQFSSVTQSCAALHNPGDCSTPGLPIHHQLPEFTQTHVHWVSDAIQSHLLSSPSPPAFNLPQHQGLFQWVSSSHQVAKLLGFQLQHQSFQWTFRTDFL